MQKITNQLEEMMKGKPQRRDNLTNQVLIEKFTSPFALVNHAILVLKHRMMAGSADSGEAFASSSENVVNVILRDIASGKDGCDIEGEEDKYEIPEPVAQPADNRSYRGSEHRPGERPYGGEHRSHHHTEKPSSPSDAV